MDRNHAELFGITSGIRLLPPLPRPYVTGVKFSPRAVDSASLAPTVVIFCSIQIKTVQPVQIHLLRWHGRLMVSSCSSREQAKSPVSTFPSRCLQNGRSMKTTWVIYSIQWQIHCVCHRLISFAMGVCPTSRPVVLLDTPQESDALLSHQVGGISHVEPARISQFTISEVSFHLSILIAVISDKTHK